MDAVTPLESCCHCQVARQTTWSCLHVFLFGCGKLSFCAGGLFLPSHTKFQSLQNSNVGVICFCEISQDTMCLYIQS